MIPADLHDFMVASLGASASFIGLLFVGLSVVLQRVESDQKIAASDRLLAESSYAALVNIFFVSLVSLLPNASIGIVCTIMALLGIGNATRIVTKKNTNPILFTSLAYLVELILGIYIIFHSNRVINMPALETIFFTLFATALIRAWELTGISERK